MYSSALSLYETSRITRRTIHIQAKDRVVEHVVLRRLDVDTGEVVPQRHDVAAVEQAPQIVGVDADPIALQLAQQPALQAFRLQLGEKDVDFVVVLGAAIADEDGGAILFINEAEFFGSRPEIDLTLPGNPQQIDDAMPVELGIAVEALEVAGEMRDGQRVGIRRQHAPLHAGRAFRLAQQARRGWFGGNKDVNLPFFQPPLAVAPPGGLGDGVESGEGPVDHGKVDIDPSFDELRGNDANRPCGFAAGERQLIPVKLSATTSGIATIKLAVTGPDGFKVDRVWPIEIRAPQLPTSVDEVAELKKELRAMQAAGHA